MKLIKNLAIAFLAVFSVSCGDPELPFETFDDLGYGAYARQLDKSGIYDFFDIANSSVTVEVEFYDENEGKNVETYAWTVEYLSNGGNGGVDIAPADLFTLNSSSFGTSAQGLPGAVIALPLSDALSALGMVVGDVGPGDVFRYATVITKKDGSTFSSANTGTNLAGSTFKALFSMSIPVICPSDLGGTYNTSSLAWCGGAAEVGTSTWTEVSEGIYEVEDFAFGAYFPCYGPGATLPGGSLQIQDACNVIKPIGTSRWGEVYFYNDVTVAGADLILDWENDYGEAGVTTLTRTDGTDWPALTK